MKWRFRSNVMDIPAIEMNTILKQSRLDDFCLRRKAVSLFVRRRYMVALRGTDAPGFCKKSRQ